MWKCDYKLLKAQNRTVNRSHHENAVVWNLFILMTYSTGRGYSFDTWSYHMILKANKRLNIKRLVALVYDKYFGFYLQACIKYKCSLLYSFVSAWSNHLVVVWSCDPYFLPNGANNFCSIFRLSQVTNRGSTCLSENDMHYFNISLTYPRKQRNHIHLHITYNITYTVFLGFKV